MGSRHDPRFLLSGRPPQRRPPPVISIGEQKKTAIRNAGHLHPSVVAARSFGSPQCQTVLQRPIDTNINLPTKLKASEISLLRLSLDQGHVNDDASEPVIGKLLVIQDRIFGGKILPISFHDSVLLQKIDTRQ